MRRSSQSASHRLRLRITAPSSAWVFVNSVERNSSVVMLVAVPFARFDKQLTHGLSLARLLLAGLVRSEAELRILLRLLAGAPVFPFALVSHRWTSCWPCRFKHECKYMIYHSFK